MANERGKEVDTTYLSLEAAEDRGFIHRDYIAHCLRWSHVVRHLMRGGRYRPARILDIGCGRELPLPKMIYSNKMVPAAYYGVDAGPMVEEAVQALRAGKMGPISHLFPQTLFSSKWAHNQFDGQEGMDYVSDIVCFECAEHVEPNMLKDMLSGMRLVLQPVTGRVWISTPCWDYKSCAANHVNEMTYGAFGSMLMEAGFIIENVHGTFASISDYAGKLNAAYVEVFNDLRAYYDSNVLAVIFAPMFPAQSRNCLWELRTPKKGEQPNWQWLETQQKPWGSSAQWESMARENWQDNWK